MRNTMLRFLQENKDSVVVYNALHKQDATLLKNFLTTGGIPESNYMIFCPDSEQSKTAKLLTGLTALHYAVEHRDSGKKVLFCMKDMFEYNIETAA